MRTRLLSFTTLCGGLILFVVALLMLRMNPFHWADNWLVLLSPVLIAAGATGLLAGHQARSVLPVTAGSGLVFGLYCVAGLLGWVTLPEKLWVLLVGRAGEGLWAQLIYVLWG